jgi:xanthine/uracil permease
LVAEAACALEDGVFIRKLVSSTFMLSGVTTFLQVMFGIRLPVYQGPSGSYAVPIIALNKMDASRCDVNAMCKFKFKFYLQIRMLTWMILGFWKAVLVKKNRLDCLIGVNMVWRKIASPKMKNTKRQ